MSNDVNQTSNLEAELVRRIDPSIAQAIELREWWLERDATNTYPNRFKQAFVFNRPEDESFGFYGTASMRDGKMQVNGNVQHMFYDAPKTPQSFSPFDSADWLRQQLREFVFRYFLRISDYRLPQPVRDCRSASKTIFDVFSQCPKNDPEREGFGFRQRLFKQKHTGRIGRFELGSQDAVLDMREIGETYDWILLKNPIYDFELEFAPFGKAGPNFVLPLPEFNYLAVSKDFIIDEDNPEPGVLGRYGIGYAFVIDPSTGIFAYGPGDLGPAFEQLTWSVMADGRILAKFVFVANQPQRLLNISLNPLRWMAQFTKLFSTTNSNGSQPRDFNSRTPFSNWGFDPVFPAVDLLNVLTFGQASQQLCISRTDIIKSLLYVHFLQHYQMAVGSMHTWRQVPNWLDEASIPDFAMTGKSS